MQNKFEQLLDYLVNEETDKANELFHQIVVEKSRGIYENLIADEEKEESEKNKKDKEDDDLDENYGEESVIEIGGDPTDDMMGDVEFDDEGEEDEMGMDAEFGDEEGGHDEEQDDRIDDLEAALDDLKAEFEKLMSGEDEEEMGDDEMDMEVDMDSEEEKESFIREYTEKVPAGHGAEKRGAGEKNANTKSIVAGENNMGGTAFKLGAGGDEKGGVKGGLLNPSPKDMNTGNVNVKGGTNAKQFFTKNSSGHGTEKKGSGEEGGVNTKSPLSPSHNK